jgi:hypothetical protein
MKKHQKQLKKPFKLIKIKKNELKINITLIGGNYYG